MNARGNKLLEFLRDNNHLDLEVPDIAFSVKKSEKTVEAALQKLQQKGLVTARQNEYGRVYWYALPSAPITRTFRIDELKAIKEDFVNDDSGIEDEEVDLNELQKMPANEPGKNTVPEQNEESANRKEEKATDSIKKPTAKSEKKPTAGTAKKTTAKSAKKATVNSAKKTSAKSTAKKTKKSTVKSDKEVSELETTDSESTEKVEGTVLDSTLSSVKKTAPPVVNTSKEPASDEIEFEVTSKEPKPSEDTFAPSNKETGEEMNNNSSDSEGKQSEHSDVYRQQRKMTVQALIVVGFISFIGLIRGCGTDRKINDIQAAIPVDVATSKDIGDLKVQLKKFEELEKQIAGMNGMVDSLKNEIDSLQKQVSAISKNDKKKTVRSRRRRR